MTALTILLVAAYAGDAGPTSPTPPADAPTANAYILPGAVDLGANAFGDEPVVIHKGERLRWRNADLGEHIRVRGVRARTVRQWTPWSAPPSHTHGPPVIASAIGYQLGPRFPMLIAAIAPMVPITKPRTATTNT